MHVSVHCNGWGPHPNPDGYTTAPIHAAFEGAAGASELHDEIVDAWRQCTQVVVGYPFVKASDIEAGRLRITPDTFGPD